MFSTDISQLGVRVKSNGHHHSVQFYQDDAKLLAGLSRYVGSALGRGDSAVVIATPAHRAELKKRLEGYGFDISFPRLKRRYIELDAADILKKFMLGGVPDPAAFSEIASHLLIRARVSAEGEHPRVVAFGEMVALLWEQGNAEGAIRLERLWNDLAHTNSFSLRCAYPKSSFAPGHEELFLKICAEHSHVTTVDEEILQ